MILIKDFSTTACCLLIVEKDAVFQQLVEEKVHICANCIIITVCIYFILNGYSKIFLGERVPRSQNVGAASRNPGRLSIASLLGSC